MVNKVSPLFLIACAVLILLWWLGREYRECETTQPHTEDDKSKVQRPSADTFAGKTFQNAKHRANRYRKYFDKPKNQITVLTLLAAIYYTWLTQGELNEMKRQQDITILQLSPAFKFEMPKEISGSGQDTVFIFRPKWTNTGQTDALSFRSWDQRRVFLNGEAKSFNFRTPPDYFVSSPAFTIAAGGETNNYTLEFTIEEMKNVALNKSEIMLIWGYIEWRDRLPGTSIHHRYWCNQITAGIASDGTIGMYDPATSSDCGLPENDT